MWFSSNSRKSTLVETETHKLTFKTMTNFVCFTQNHIIVANENFLIDFHLEIRLILIKENFLV